MYKLVFLFLITPCFAFGQYTKLIKIKNGIMGIEVTKKEATLLKKYNTCFNNRKYSKKQLHALYPFNKATTVKLISFSLPSDSSQPDDNPSVYTPISVGHYKLNHNRIKEIKELSNAAIDSLTDIMYNIGHTPLKHKLQIAFVDPGHNCYDPHNAVLFFDENGVVNEYFEICFGCQRYFLSSRKMKDIKYCEQKYEMLRSFFSVQGINFGTALSKHDEE